MTRHALRRAALSALALVLPLLAAPAGGGPVAAATPPCYTAQPSPTGTVNPAVTSNPLDNGRWAAGHPRWEELWIAYCDETDPARKALLGKIALRPRAYWFTPEYPTYDTSTRRGIRFRVDQYINESQRGDPSVIVHLSVFRLWPDGESRATTPLTAAQKTAYRAWIDQLQAGIGNRRVAIVLEPDLGITMRKISGSNRADRLALVRYASSVLSRNPNAAIYLDGSSADWLHVDEAVTMLRLAGIGHVRGFALGGTHYSRLHRTSTSDRERLGEVRYAAQVVQRLNATGLASLKNKRAVIDTSDNPRGFTMRQYYAEHPRSQVNWFDNAQICTSRTDGTCVTLGIPPTWQVAQDRFVQTVQLDTTEQALARTYVDGYLWFGRSWQYAQSAPFRLDRALGMARTTTLG